MNQGMQTNPNKKSRNAVSHYKRSTVMIVAIALLLICTVGGTIAYFTDMETSVSHFGIGNVACTAAINDDGSITVTNTGNVAAYVRVAVIASWVDEEGMLYYSQPAVTCTDTKWTNRDNYFYCNTSVPAGTSVNLPIAVTGTAPDGYKLQIEALAEAIQENAAGDAWKFTSSGN